MSNQQTLTRDILFQADETARSGMIYDYLASQTIEILRCSSKDISPNRRLIDLGMSSFMAGEFSYLIESDLGVIIQLTHFFDGSSLTDLTKLVLSEIEKTSPKAALPSIPSVDQYPLSVGQQALWALYQMSPDSTAYNLAYAMRIQQALDVPMLQRVFEKLSQRHPALRTAFTTEMGEPVQQIDPEARVIVETVDAAGWSDADLSQKLAEQAHLPFDLEQAPLLRAILFTRSAQEHVLLLVIHHIVTDFWSLAALIHEMGQLYEAEQTGIPAALSPIQTQYSDFVAWQSNTLADEKGDSLWMYWQKQLAGDLPVLELPTDRVRPSMQTYVGAAESCTLSAETTRKLKALSQKQGATLYMTLLASFHALLHRYTGQDEILLGTAVSGRAQASFQHVGGFFVNTLVMRAHFENDPTFIEFLQQVRQTELEGLEHQDYPFATLVKRLKPTRDFSRSPIFQGMFVFQQPRMTGEENMVALDLGVDGAAVHIPGLPFETVAVERQTAQFDLTMVAGEVNDQLAVLFKYNTDLFDAATIVRMLTHWQTLLNSALDDPNQHISALPLLTALERQQMLAGWNNASTAIESIETTLPDLFEAQVQRTPSATALVFEQQRLTYNELNQRANQLAWYLQSLGVGPDISVGVCLERSVDLIVGLLGVLKAGGVYVPLDPAYPAERLAFMQANAQFAALVTVETLAQSILLDQPNRICLDTSQAVLARQSTDNPSRAITPEHLAYIIYTSGSTGKPKGVMVPHRAICNHMRWRASALPMDADDRFMQLASASFDVSVWEIFSPLLTGGQLILPRAGGEKDLHSLSRLIAEQAVTHVRLGPSLLSVFLEQGNLDNMHSLKRVFCGGETLPFDLQERFFELLPAVSLYNQYGPTETCVAATIWQCEPQSERSVVPIGRPIANTRVYILDASLQPMPVGLAGDLYIGGAGLARGYLGRPDLTEERFLVDPFIYTNATMDRGPLTVGNDGLPSTVNGLASTVHRLYKTGDRARYLPDGVLEFLGRKDSQVKIRGFRVELGEVEAVLSQHPDLVQVVVDARAERETLFGDATPTQQLTAYVVARPPAKPSLTDLRNFAKQQLPDYMIPSAFVFLDVMPLTPNGKVDRKALPALDVSRPELDGAYEAPRTPVEEVLAEMWAGLLDMERVGIHDSFFELGGHSLLAVQSMALLQDLFGIDEPLIILFFENPTIAGLATALTESLPDHENTEKIAEKLRMVMNMSDDEVENLLAELDSDR